MIKFEIFGFIRAFAEGNVGIASFLVALGAILYVVLKLNRAI